jgi:hypothetical protein
MLTNLQHLWLSYQAASKQPRTSEYFSSAVRFGFEKLNTYFERLVMEPDPSFYVVATALHPKLRLTWFKTHWKDFPRWHAKAEKSIRKVFKQYVDLEVEHETEEPLPPPRRKQPAARDSAFEDETMSVDLMLLTGARTFKRAKRVSQLDEYFGDIREDLTNTSMAHQKLLADPWLWWLQIGRTRYPVIFKMARDYLTIPSTSCDCERAFSRARRTITSDRNALSCSTVEALQLQKDWLNRGVVQSELADLQDFLADPGTTVQKDREEDQSTESQDSSAS